MIFLELKRRKYTDQQTIGTMNVYKDGVFVCCLATLELDWESNERNSSCIPANGYNLTHYSSDKYKNVLQVMDVPNRSYILIHNGNYNKHTKGCILVGLTHTDINADGYLDVQSSMAAMNKLMGICEGQKRMLLEITA